MRLMISLCLYVITIALTGAFAMIAANAAPNPNAPLWILMVLMANVLAFCTLFSGALNYRMRMYELEDRDDTITKN